MKTTTGSLAAIAALVLALAFTGCWGGSKTGVELDRHTYKNETYVLVEYGGDLAVFSESGAAVTGRTLAEEVLSSYAWAQALAELDLGLVADTVNTVEQIASSTRGVRSLSNATVDIFDELESLGANVPLMGRVSAIDVVRKAYPGVGVAQSSIRSLNSELNELGENAEALVKASGYVSGLGGSSDVEGDYMARLFGDAASAAGGLSGTVETVRGSVSEVRGVVSDLESALREASDTPVIGDAIRGLASIAGRFESELGNLTSLLGDFGGDLDAVADLFRDPLESATEAGEGYVKRWTGDPPDAQWPPSDQEQPAAGSPTQDEAREQATGGVGAPPVPPTPTPTAASKPPGYLHGEEHGIAVLGTTRRPSETREGWVDITLTLATLKFAGDIDDREYETDANSLCYVNSQPPHDCLFIAWGSEEQFEAEIRASHPVSDMGWAFKTDILHVTFEVAANATEASLFFGEQHKIPLHLQGVEGFVVSYADPEPAPTPAPSSGPSAGYFMDDDYGIAIIAVHRERMRDSALSRVTVNTSVLSLREDGALAPEIYVDDMGSYPGICFGDSTPQPCLQVKWGAEGQFDAGLIDGPNFIGSYTDWPRGMGLPVSFHFFVPEFVGGQATIEFGEHRIPIDLRGMVGEEPAWDYRLHYPELQIGSTLYDSNKKTVVLDEVRQEEDTGDITLVFSAKNDSEATDFAPVIELVGSRVSHSGTLFDGGLDPSDDWMPHTVRIEGDKLAPGQNGRIEYTVARVLGEGWRFAPYSKDPKDLPSAIILELAVNDLLVEDFPIVSVVGSVDFTATDNYRHWNIWSGAPLWSYGVNTRITSLSVADGVIYVGTSDGVYGRRAYVYALDTAEGELLWTSWSAFDPYYVGTVTDGIVYVTLNDDLTVLDAVSRDRLWGRTNSRPLAVADGVLYVESGGLYALDAADGETLWHYEIDGGLSLAVTGDVVYASAPNGLYAPKAASGKTLWEQSTRFGNLSLAAADGVVFGRGYETGDLYALDGASGELLWHLEIDSLRSPFAADDVVYVGSEDGHFYALDGASGELLWRRGISSSGSPIAADGVVYVRSLDGHLYALDAASGELLGRYETEQFGPSPVVAHGVVYVASGGRLTAIVASPPR